MHVSVCVLVCMLSVCSALICPDGGMCEDGNTCCLTPGSGYGCCPLPNAECCSDHLHCCYEGTQCDMERGTCLNKTHTLEWARRVSAKQTTRVQAVVCPDQKSECPDDTTCCQMPDWTWGCCPMPNAVCCDDKKHCCPQGTTCDLPHSKCRSAAQDSTPLLRKFPAIRKGSAQDEISAKLPGSNDVTCPDKISTCPDDTTCCQLVNGSYGCCPMPNAVCCSDHIHCCPEGTTCDLEHDTCLSANELTEMSIEATPILLIKQTAASVTRGFSATTESDSQHKCDARTSCPRGSTCCYVTKLSKWGCCPLPQAVCCGDGDHCCPSGYTCDKEKPVCVKGILQIPWVKKQPAETAQRSEVTSRLGDVKCDGTTSCAAGTTCCRLRTGKWACCPLAQAVCCEDHEHCCPHDYTCELSSGTCIKPFSTHTVAFTLIHTLYDVDGGDGEVMCDHARSCPESQTCCPGSDTDWTCCPLEQAVCCKDMKHCCPKGYTCDPAERCTKASPLTWWDNSL